jgi:hypothetical protein
VDHHIEQRFTAPFGFCRRLYLKAFFEALPFSLALHIEPLAELVEMLLRTERAAAV